MAKAKKPTKKSEPKKKAVKKPAAKKTVSKKAPAKKSRAKKQAPKKTAQKKPASKKTAKKAAPAKKPSINTIFLTGFPGFIGKRVMESLLSISRQAHFVLLVQEKFEAQAKRDLKKMADDFPGLEKRSEILLGDLQKDGLGLESQTLNRLKDEVSQVWHLAAVYDLAVKSDIAFQINVHGTQRVVNLCNAMKGIQKFVYFSTCYVSGTRTGLILEDELDMGQSFKNNYEATKFEAEKIVRDNMGRLPTIIIRPAIVVGDSETGETDKFDGPYYLLKLLARLESYNWLVGGLRLPSLGRGDAYFNLVPVDYVARVAVHIAQDTDNVGKCFQICDPNPVTMRQFTSMAYREFGFGDVWGAIPVSLADWLLQAPKLRELVKVPVEALPFTDHFTLYDCANTTSALAQTDIHCPDIRDYFETIVEFVRNNPRTEAQAKY